VQESKQRTQTRLSASLRLRLRANLRHAIQAAVPPNSLRAFSAPAQTNGGKSEHDATLSYGSVARSPNGLPQALTHGWVRERTACKICDEISLYYLPVLR